MSPQRRTALASVGAALALIALKLGTGLATGSLGLLSEAAHSGTDFVAALLTFFAVGVAGRPADPAHQYGHGKAEHLGALAEGTILVAVSLVIAWRAVLRLTGHASAHVDAASYALVVLGVVIAIDLSRTLVSMRASRRYASAALASNALHFASDLGGSTAVLIGLVLVRADIHHALWDLQSATAEIDVNTMPPVELPDEEPLCHFSRRQDVVIWPLEPVGG